MSSVVEAQRTVETPDGTHVASVGAADRAAARRRHERIAAVLGPVGLIVLWEIVVQLGLLDARFFPAPSHVAGTFWELIVTGSLLADLAISLRRIVVGFLLGALPGVLVGLTMGMFRLFRAAAWPIIGALYPIPKLALLPLFLLLFGLGETSKYAIIATGAFFPSAINTMAGVSGILPIYHDVGRNFGAGQLARYRTIAIPGALPMIVAGLRLAWGIALLLIVAAEFVAAREGIGYLVWDSWRTFRVEQMYSGIITLSLLGFASFKALDVLERVVAPWKGDDDS